MFDYEFQGEVKRIETLVPKVDGPVMKICRVTFRRDFDVDIARGVGGEFGVEALKCLHDRAITNVVFPIDAICVKASLKGTAGDALLLDEITGIKAVGKARKLQEDKEPDEPQVELKFQFRYSKEAWDFFGANACQTVSIKLTKRQMELKLGTAAASPEVANGEKPKPNGRKKRGRGTKSSHGHDRAEAAGEISDDPQGAITPEEAEELRAQRLREERQAEEGVWADEESCTDKADAGAGADEEMVF